MDSLIQALARQQDLEGLGNNAFARKLGVDQSTWSRLRRGVTEWRSAAVFEAAMRTYPEIVVSVAQALADSNVSVADDQQPEKVPAVAEVA